MKFGQETRNVVLSYRVNVFHCVEPFGRDSYECDRHTDELIDRIAFSNSTM